MSGGLRRHGATAVLAIPVIGFMALTAAAPSTYEWLARNFAVRWSDLFSGQIYRVAVVGVAIALTARHPRWRSCATVE